MKQWYYDSIFYAAESFCIGKDNEFQILIDLKSLNMHLKMFDQTKIMIIVAASQTFVGFTDDFGTADFINILKLLKA